MILISRFMEKPFEPEVENLYQEFFFRNSLSVIRVTLIASALFFVLSGLTDALVADKHHIVIAAIRYGVLVPVLLIAYYLTFKSFFVNIWQRLLLVMVVFNGVAIMVMITVEPGNMVRYAELMFVLVTGYFFLRLQPPLAQLIIWLFTVGFIGVIALDGGISTEYLLFYSLIFVTANFIVMATVGYFHSQNRKIFSLNLENNRNCPAREVGAGNNPALDKPLAGIDNELSRHRLDGGQCPLMVFEIDMDGKITYANDKAVKNTGMSQHDINSGVQFTGLFLPEEREKVLAFVKGQQSETEQSIPSFTLKGNQSTLFIVRVFSNTILKNGHVAGWRIILLDISGQIKAEGALREIEERYSLLANNVFDGVFIYGEGVLEYTSRRLCMILGYEESELLDKSFDLSRLLTNESIIAVKNTISTKLGHKHASPRVELSVITKGGALRDVEVVFALVPKDQVQQLFGVVRDITEFKTAERLREELTLTNQSALFKQQFKAKLSHEIRTQITGIVGIIEVLSGVIRNVKHSEYVQILEASTDKLIGAINKIVAFSDKEAGSAGSRSVIHNDQKKFSNRSFDRSIEAIKSLRILVVEDKQINQKVIELILSSMGHRVTIAGNGMQALEIFTPGAFDLILMDIKMPVMDGFTATKELKRKYLDLPPIVGLSASPFSNNHESYANIGMDDYITKPVRREDFARLIKKLGI